MALCGEKPGEYINPMTNETKPINECDIMPTLCKPGTCHDTPTGFQCGCDHGLQTYYYLYNKENKTIRMIVVLELCLELHQAKIINIFCCQLKIVARFELFLVTKATEPRNYYNFISL